MRMHASHDYSSSVPILAKGCRLHAQGYPARIIDTRKTVPGLRVLDKWAVLIGGGSNHRIGLHDMVMIKNNHIAAAGGIAAAIRCCQVGRDAALCSLTHSAESRPCMQLTLDLIPEAHSNG
jgi:nicotinate-nucleotide pyrophosphorylase